MRKDKINSKLLLLIIAIAVGVTIATLLVADIVGSNLLFSPGSKSDSPDRNFVNAHECTLDGTCEINSIASASGGEILLSGNTRITGNLLVDGVNSMECYYNNVNSEVGGEETCQLFSYDYCLIAEYGTLTTYYDSVNNSCQGNKQSVGSNIAIGPCPTVGSNYLNYSTCSINSEGTEPYYGDIGVSLGRLDIHVVCCR